MNIRNILILVFFINLIQGICTPIIDDEAYYWMWSQRLAAGYFDHPPMIAIWVKLSDWIMDGEIGARFITICMNTLTVFFLWKILNPKNKQQIKVFTITYFSLIMVQIFTWVSTPDAPLLFFTIFYLYSLKRFLKESTLLNTALLSVCFAGLMYSKYHGVLVLAFTLLPIITFLYKKPQFYFAILSSLLLYSPHFYWLYINEFPPVSYHFIDRSAEQKFSWAQPFVYILTALFGAAGLLVYHLLKSIQAADRSEVFKRSVFWLTIGPFFFFLLSTLKDTTQAQWLLISYFGGGILMYWKYANEKNIKLFTRLGLATVCLIFIARVIIMLPASSPFYENKNFAKVVGNNTSHQIVAFEKYQEASIFQFYNRNKRGVVYRTLGNRNSQFTLWNDEALLNQSFNFVTPWMKSDVEIDGLKHKTYYINTIENYTPIHLAKGEFLTFDGNEIGDSKITLSQNNSHQLNFMLSEVDYNLINSNHYALNLFVTKDQQYNVVEVWNISKLAPTVNNNDSTILNLESMINTGLEPGEYAVYIGITPAVLTAKFVSKPLKIIVTE